MPVKEINLKRDRPIVAEALHRLLQAIENAKRERSGPLKIIHGYGSQGSGGAIREAVREQLTELKRQGKIRGFIDGERLSPFDHDAVRALDSYPELNQIAEWNAGNAGVTIVFV